MLSFQFILNHPLMLAGFQISTGEFFAGALLTVAGLSAVLFGSKFYFANQSAEAQDSDPLARKNENVQTEKHRQTFFWVGASSALVLVFLAMNWTTVSRQIDVIADLGEPETLAIDIPNTSTPVAPPPPDAPKPPLEMADDFKVETTEIDETPEQKPADQPVTEFGNGDAGSQGFSGGQAGGTGTSPLPVVEVEPEKKVDEQEIFIRVEKMPILSVCGADANMSEADKKACSDKALLGFLYEHLRYPAIAKDLGIEGTVTLAFVVEKDGTLSDIKVLKSIGGGCEEEAVRVLQKLAKERTWIAGSQRGRPVRVKYTMPVRFKLKN